jgi:hypothetical protein
MATRLSYSLAMPNEPLSEADILEAGYDLSAICAKGWPPWKRYQHKLSLLA